MSIDELYIAPPYQPIPKGEYYCSFCGKNQCEVFFMIAGPTVYICDECVDLCREIVDERRAAKRAKHTAWVQHVLSVRVRPDAPHAGTRPIPSRPVYKVWPLKCRHLIGMLFK